jgi:flagellar hook-associated protein 3 FlgL
MSVAPINVTRVSHNLRTLTMLDTLRANMRDMLLQQNRLATGRRFTTASENPIAASQSLQLNSTMTRQVQILENLRHADLVLSSSDEALTEVNELLSQAESIAAASIGAQASADEREANAALIASIRERLMAIGNRQVQGRYIFAGRDNLRVPFISALGGVAYGGDSGEVLAQVSLTEQQGINVPGDRLFGGLATAVVSTDDLQPALTLDTRLEDLGGANQQGIRKGSVILTDGTTTTVVDLSDANTVGDVVDMINAAAASASLDLTVAIDGSGLSVTGNSVSVRDTTTGVTASDLGIVREAGAAPPIESVDLRPRLTANTPVSALNLGAGASLDDGIRITNGTESVVIDLSDAERVQDVINEINTTGVFVTARISDNGQRLDIVSQVSGAGLAISENGGTTATDFGILTFSPDVSLSSLNSGRGVELLEGEPDIRIEAKDGSVLDVNLDGAETLGDVVDLINQAAADASVAVEAGFGTDANGLLIQDNTGGTGLLTVTRPSIASFAVDDLGLQGTVPDPETEMLGTDVSRVRADSVFTTLIDLERALLGNDERAVTDASQRLQQSMDEVTRVHGTVGARAQSMRDRVTQTESAVVATESLLSEIEDLDYSEAVTVFQQAQTALQANLLSGSQLLSLSLMDFLR